MAHEDEWKARSKTLPNGRVVKWRERRIRGDVFERIYETEGEVRSAPAQPVTLRSS